MAQRTRAALLFLAAIVVIAVALAVLAYAYWPINNLTEQVPLAPTLFTPP
jgi:hypothetical protein